MNKPSKKLEEVDLSRLSSEDRDEIIRGYELQQIVEQEWDKLSPIDRVAETLAGRGMDTVRTLTKTEIDLIKKIK